jgi:hypothetical protein
MRAQTAAAGVMLGLSACTSIAAPDDRPPPPSALLLDVVAGEANVLAAFAEVVTTNADSVRLLFRGPGQQADSATPAVAASDTLQLAGLGLLPDTRYEFRVRAYGRGGTSLSAMRSVTTGSLPADLPSYTTSGSYSEPGFVVFGSGRYGIVIDNSGRVVWYHRFDPNGPGLNFIAQGNGRYAAQPPTGDGSPGAWQEVDPSGRVTRTFGCVNGLSSRFHDLIREADDSFWIICDDVRTVDLSMHGGHPAARVTAAEIQHVASDGALRFRWNAFDHLDVTDLPPAERGGPNVNWTHANAIALTGDGTLLVSFRNLSEITAISIGTGIMLWRLGGARDEFGLSACCLPVFVRQHGVRVTADGHLILLDNLGTSGDSQVRRLAVNPGSRTVQPQAAFSATPPVVAALGGSVQELPGGQILAAFGDGRRVEQFDQAGNVVWRINGDPGYVFRAQRIRSLYSPGVGTTR